MGLDFQILLKWPPSSYWLDPPLIAIIEVSRSFLAVWRLTRNRWKAKMGR